MKNIPNILCWLRIALIPFFIWQMTVGNFVAAAAILAVSGITDFFDGFLARKFGWISQFGKVLDPVADKLTQVSVSIVLAIRLRQFMPFFVVLLGKEFVMLVVGGYLVKKGVRIDGAKWFGKVVTVLFYGVMIAIIFIPMPPWLISALLSIVTLCAIIAALMYLPEYRRYRSQLKEND